MAKTVNRYAIARTTALVMLQEGVIVHQAGRGLTATFHAMMDFMELVAVKNAWRHL